MRRRRGPVFLARRSYRLRRMRDAARLLPIAGAFLFMLPILWSPGESAGQDTAPDGMYLFGVWFCLILAAALMSRGLRAASADVPAGAEGDG